MRFGCGKTILLGEHSVVYGYPALAASLSRGVRAQASTSNEDVLEVKPWNVRIKPSAQADDLLARAFHVALSFHNEPRERVCVKADVALPGGAGLGCSAALGVAVMGALDEHFKVQRTQGDLATHSLAWERVFHGNPSGVDNAMAALGGIAFFQKGEPLQRIVARHPIQLVVADSGEASSTHTMVSGVARQHEQNPERVKKVFEGIAALVRNGRLALEAGDSKAFGQLMNFNHALLNSLMVSTSRIEELCIAAKDAGALGAKITGAGGGGCIIALVTEDTASAVANALKPIAKSVFVEQAGNVAGEKSE